MKHILSHYILMLGKSPIKWGQRPDMNIAIDWDVKHYFKFKLIKEWKSDNILNANYYSATNNEDRILRIKCI